MSVNTYLNDLASNLVLSNDENESIKKSITTLESRLFSWFGSDVIENFKFGSYTRGTILPRKVDSESDIDYMVVFNNYDGCKPQAYLNRLKRFVEYYYSTSEIHQSSPTIVLKLNHIKFELVPAYNEYGTYRIPDGKDNWMDTDPNDINKQLTEVNQINASKIKPVIRLIKYWNIDTCDRNFISYILEKNLINDLRYSFFTCSSYTDYLKKALESLKNKTSRENILSKINNSVNRIDKALEYKKNCQPSLALSEIKKVFPEA